MTVLDLAKASKCAKEIKEVLKLCFGTEAFSLSHVRAVISQVKAGSGLERVRGTMPPEEVTKTFQKWVEC